VVTFILVRFIVQRGGKILFTRNEQLCLVISCITLAAWAITKTAWVGFCGFQVVMVVAYFPTIESGLAMEARQSPDLSKRWSINAVAAVIGCSSTLRELRIYLAMLYPVRALVLCLIIVVLVKRWEQKNKTNH